MSTEPINTIRLYEHAGNVAIRIGHSDIVGECPTKYISTDMALKLGKELIEASQQIKNWNHYETKVIKKVQ